jgi:hypothetical protein
VKSSVARWLVLTVAVWGMILGNACGASGGDQTGTTATASPAATTPTAGAAITREMLKAMIPGAGDLPAFTISDARFLDNEGASARAPDPAARLARLQEMGRIVGFHAIFSRTEEGPFGTPSAILWSVNLFQQPSGALDFTNQQPDVPEGLTYESMDVSTLGSNAVGFAFRSSVPDKVASSYSVAFAEGVIEVSLTTLYEGIEAPPDYTLNLAQQARTLVRNALISEPP